MAHDVFISYSSSDKTTSDAACSILERHGLRCWIAPRDILAGLDWSSAIIEAIGESRVVVLIFSAQSNRSEQVKREVQQAVNGAKPILPFRIENVPPSKHMQYFIGTSHWMDALTDEMDDHLHRLAATVLRLLDMAAVPGLSVRVSISTTAPKSDRSAVPEGVSTGLGPGSSSPAEGRALGLHIFSGTRVRNVCLLTKPLIRMGKHRHNDIVLRVLPPSPANDERSDRISRHHATITLSAGGATLQNLASPNGTWVGPHYFGPEVKTELTNGAVIRPAGVLALACDLYRAHSTVDCCSDRGASVQSDPTQGDEQLDRVSTLRLRRMDCLAGLEQYVVFTHAAWLGREPTCPILVADPSIAPRHALMLWSDGDFWLQSVQEEFRTVCGGQVVPLRCPVVLRPGLELWLGDVRALVAEPGQYYLDLPVEAMEH